MSPRLRDVPDRCGDRQGRYHLRKLAPAPIDAPVDLAIGVSMLMDQAGDTQFATFCAVMTWTRRGSGDHAGRWLRAWVALRRAPGGRERHHQPLDRGEAGLPRRCGVESRGVGAGGR